MADVEQGASNSLDVGDSVSVFLSLSPYCTVDWANQYCLELLGTQPWDDASEADQEKALRLATRKIDRLNFLGDKTDSEQRRQFPRGGDTAIPNAIKFATVHLAIKLLDGIDPEEELKNFSVTQHKIGPVNTNYMRGKIPDYIQAGIPSLEAWQYLYPYLRQTDSVRLNRTT